MDSNKGELITIIIAIYGAVLSTIVALFNIIKHFNDKPKIVVKTKPSFFYESSDPGKEIKKIGVEIINSGKRPITISYSGFKLGIKTNMNICQIIDPNLPKQIAEGESYTSYTDFIEGSHDKIIYAWVKDATGKEYKSNKWPLRGFI